MRKRERARDQPSSVLAPNLDADVAGAGQQPAGDRGGGDVVARTAGQVAGGAGDHGLALASGRPPAGSGAPRVSLLGDVAMAELAVGVAHLRGSPAPAHRWGRSGSGRGRRARRPTSWPSTGQRRAAPCGPDRGSGLANASISRSSLGIGVARASSSPQQSWRIARGWAAARGWPARPARDQSTGSGPRRCRDRPAPATGVPGTSAPRTGISVAGSWPGCGCAAGTGGVHDGDLRALAIDVHPDIAPHQASFPELVEPEAKAVGLTRGPGPDPHSVRWIPTVRAEVRRSQARCFEPRICLGA